MHELIHCYVNTPNRNNYFFDNIAISVILKDLVKNVAKRFRVEGCMPGSFIISLQHYYRRWRVSTHRITRLLRFGDSKDREYASVPALPYICSTM